MSTYVVGDIQGCYDELRQLLDTVSFDTNQDTLWLAGDLVARGPKSLETLRFVKSLGSAAKVVLGNHDLHLLAISIGIHPIKEKDRTANIFDAPDKDELFHWLRKQPLLAEHDEFVMCHAGVSPQWNLEQARAAAKEIEEVLSSAQWRWLLTNMYDNKPDLWDDNLAGIERYRYIINAYTRMRFCFNDMSLDMECKLPPNELNDDKLMPWFKLPQRVAFEKPILFGHWAALEGYSGEDVIGLDTGCVWGGHLTMIRWEDKQFFTQPAL